MFAASFGLGSIPLNMKLSEQTIARLSLVGTGLLLSSALTVILPEGAEAVYTTAEQGDTGAVLTKAQSAYSSAVGPTIIAGYLLMFLIDQIQIPIISSRPSTTTSYIAVDSLHELHEVDSSLETHQGLHVRPKNPASSTLGLCIHSLADGIALGSSAQAQTSTSFVVFAAIMIHKGPAAFALVSILLQSALSRKIIQLHLLAFSIAAPIGAMITYILISWLGLGATEASGPQASGLLLLFSAGTFLYAAISHAPKHQLDLPSCLSVLVGLLLPTIFSLFLGHSH